MFFLASLSASAQERLFGDAFLHTYGKLESYCDTGTYKYSPDVEPLTVERCIHSDGRFKQVLQTNTGHRTSDAEWSDGRQLFNLHSEFTVFDRWTYSYRVRPLSQEGHEAAALLARTILEWFQIPDGRDLRESLNHYARKADLDRDGLIAYEARSYSANPEPIIWVSPEDGLIRRTAFGSATYYTRVVDSVRTNTVLTRSDLVVAVPLRARADYFIRSNPAAAAVLVSFGAFLLGVVFWRIRWIRVRDKEDRDDEDLRAARNATLRRYSVVAGVLTLVVIAILWLSSLSKGGHPPLVVVVAVFAIPIVGLLWLGLCFMVARHLVEVPRRPLKTSE